MLERVESVSEGVESVIDKVEDRLGDKPKRVLVMAVQLVFVPTARTEKKWQGLKFECEFVKTLGACNAWVAHRHRADGL